MAPSVTARRLSGIPFKKVLQGDGAAVARGGAAPYSSSSSQVSVL